MPTLVGDALTIRSARCHLTVVGGPAELLGESVIVDEVVLDGQKLYVPRPLPAVAEYVAVARAESAANALRPRLLEATDTSGASRTSRASPQRSTSMRTPARP